MNLVTLFIILVAIPHSFAGVIGWGSWTPCTVSCGGGNRSRTAICKTGGNTCTKDKGEIVVGENQTASCNLHPCSTGEPSSTPPRTMPITNATEERNTTGKSRATPPTKPTGKINTTEQQNTTTTPEKSTNPSTITKNTTAKPTKITHKETLGVTTHAAHEPHNHGGGEGTSFEGQMKMEKQFSKDLEDKNSKAFKDLKTKCETAIDETLRNKGIVCEPDCYKFTEGSVVIHYRISTKTSVDTTKLNEAFSSSVRSGPLNALSVGAFSIARSQSDLSGESKNRATTEASDSEIVEPYLYFLYGFGGMMGLAFVFIVLAVIKRKVKPSPDADKEDLYESYFNTPVSNKKMPNDDFTTKKMKQTFDYPTDENKINKGW